MRQSLQSKFNVLGILFVVLFLLMLPMVNQVKADAKDSAKQAKSTLLSKWTRELVKSIKADDVGDAEIEDYWAKYGNEAKQKDPNCGEACDPDADPDKDGMSNKDEIKNGRNPKCNEEEKGVDYCRGLDPYAPLPPENETRTISYRTLDVFVWRASSGTGSNCTVSGTGVTFTSSCQQKQTETSRNYTRILLYLNATQVQSLQSWSFTATKAGSSVSWDRSPTGGFETSPRNYGMYVGMFEPAEPGTYSFRPNPGQATSGIWELHVVALVEA